MSELSLEEKLLAKYDLSTESGKKEYQKAMTVENLEGFTQKLINRIEEFKNGDIDEEDFLLSMGTLKIKIAEAVELVAKYHND